MDNFDLKNFDMDALKNGGDPMAMIQKMQAMLAEQTSPEKLRKMIGGADRATFEQMLERASTDMLKHGGDFLAAACFHGKPDIIELLVERGADVMAPPERIQGDADYRKASFVLQAVAGGSRGALESVLKHGGGSLSDVGFVTLTKKRRNVLVSNAVGCAAYHGRTKLLEYLLAKLGRNYLEVPAVEEADRYAAKAGVFLKEMSLYTPLMLAVAKGDENLDCVKLLLSQGADFLAKDSAENSVLHVAALNGNNKILAYLAKNLKIDIFGRNKKGETALNICAAQKNQAGADLLADFQQEYDSSKNQAADLLQELAAEEEHEEEAKAKRKQKKWRNRINRLAKQMNVSPEEVEAKLQKEEEERQLKAIEDARLEKERERREAEEEVKRKEALRKEREEMRRQELAEEERERRRAEAEAREAREEREAARRAAMLAKRERQQSERREPRAARGGEADADTERAARKERVKSAVRKPEPEQARQPR